MVKSYYTTVWEIQHHITQESSSVTRGVTVLLLIQIHQLSLLGGGGYPFVLIQFTVCHHYWGVPHGSDTIDLVSLLGVPHGSAGCQAGSQVKKIGK